MITNRTAGIVEEEKETDIFRMLYYEVEVEVLYHAMQKMSPEYHCIMAPSSYVYCRGV